MIGRRCGRLLLVAMSIACGCSSSGAQRDGGGGQGQLGGQGGTSMTVVDAAADTAPGDAGQSDVRVDAAQSDVPVDRGSTGPADASTDGGGSCFPACIVDLGIPCSRTGQACVQMASATEAVSCFANGVKSRTADGGTVVKKANGEICFEYRGGGGQAREYFDAQGNFVARFEYTISSTQFVIQCADGTTTFVDLAAPECASFMQTVCTQGQCTW
jgi:hypothetical protein